MAIAKRREGSEGQTHDVRSGQEQFGVAILIDANNAAAAGERRRDVQPAFGVECDSLRSAQAAIVVLDRAVRS